MSDVQHIFCHYHQTVECVTPILGTDRRLHFCLSMGTMTPISILDPTPIKQGSDVASTFREARELAQLAEALGYKRYWLTEHHNMPSVAGSATAVLIGHIASSTKTIRVGAGGIVLPNHAPIMVAEQFGTLATLFPGRIDLGLGRGLPCDPPTLQALRRIPNDGVEYPRDVQELLFYLAQAVPNQRVSAIPGAGTDVPVWILGSSLGGAQLAAKLGLPFAFASHLMPDQLEVALAAYRRQFVPSAWLDKPHVMLSLTVVAADTDETARLLFSSAQQATTAPLPPPIPNYEQSLEPKRLALIKHFFRHSVIGGPATVAKGISQFASYYQPDELIVTAQIFEHAAWLRSFEILSRAIDLHP